MPAAEWTISLGVPAWAADHLVGTPSLADDEARMQFVLQLADENVTWGTGGPFAAAVVARSTGRVVAIGVNSVECAAVRGDAVEIGFDEGLVPNSWQQGLADTGIEPPEARGFPKRAFRDPALRVPDLPASPPERVLYRPHEGGAGRQPGRQLRTDGRIANARCASAALSGC